ncbi:MAG: diaminopimelate epimerase [Bacteroidales bacterium]|nr:diaminopimelate epimerase [Bacteroidales bacterium]
MENKVRFTKMHGTGNDYVYIDCTNGVLPENIGELAVKISDRHFGVGSDGLVLICKSDVADFKMRMFNADGSEAQMCGNASRCIGKFVYDKRLTNKTEITLETLAGIKYLKLFVKNAIVEKIRVDMGEPILEAEKIPAYLINSPQFRINSQIINELHSFNGDEFHITVVSMGNPHCVIFVDDVENFDVHRIGKIIENSRDVFPERSNVEFVQVLDRQKLRVRVWERGAGETWACGTGASAVLVAAVLNNKSDRKAMLQLLGGDLEIEWANNNHVLMTGEATNVFEGEYFLN